jgi:hypothetical protein
MTDSRRPLRRMLVGLLLPAWVTIGCTTLHPAPGTPPPESHQPVFGHERFDRVLGVHVDENGRVDYAALKNAPQDLDAYYGLIAAVSPDSHPQLFPDRDHQLAYWINAYNAAVIKAVLAHYPIESVIDVQSPAPFSLLSDKAGFFFFQRPIFGGRSTSLYYLENGVIRKRFDDPRFHFALNCASVGCPRLPRQSFSGQTLDRQLDTETRRFLAEARNFRIAHAEKAIYLSSIFKWYRKDFTDWYQRRHPGKTAGLLDYVRLYLPPESARALAAARGRYAIRFVPYDWGLNDRKTPA